MSPRRRSGDEEPPPQELTWDSTLKDLLGASYTFSPDLTDLEHPPRFIRMYEDRWSVRWDESGIPDPQAQSCVDLSITVRPVAPATIEIKT
jgi:hypothetical protein